MIAFGPGPLKPVFRRRDTHGMHQVSAIDGFRLAYDRSGRGPAVVMLHGWPGGRGDYREVVPLLAGAADVITPDLRGFGESDQHQVDPAAQYSAAAQARSVAGLIAELGLTQPVIVGYDIGSRIAQTLAAERPDLVRALVISPPVPGIGGRILSPDAQREFWYQQFHRLDLATELIDGHPGAVRAYLRHFWEHWSGPDFELPAQHLEDLVTAYAPPGRSRRLLAGTGPGPDRWPDPSRNSRPRQRTGSACRPPCCGPRTTRSSRRSGRTGSTSSSRTPG